MKDKSNIEFVEVLTQVLGQNHGNVSFNGRSIRFGVPLSKKDELQNAFGNVGVEPDWHLNDDCEIRIDFVYNHGSLILFYNEEDFLGRGPRYFETFDALTLVILRNSKGSLLKFPYETFSPQKIIFFNYYYYHKILTFLRAEKEFISVNDDAHSRFIIFWDKGPFYIGFKILEPRITNLENLGPVYSIMENEFKKTEFVQFFKSAVINTVYQYPVEERFFFLVQSLRVIINIATRDHYVYIRNFDFQKIKSKFQQGKKDYFRSLDSSIESINKQVTAFPLTFAASTFAAFQVKEKPTILILILSAYILYTFIAWKILNVTIHNIHSIQDDVKNEEGRIKEHYELIYNDFEPDFRVIYDKILRIKKLITVLKSVLLGLLFSFIIFSVYEIFFK